MEDNFKKLIEKKKSEGKSISPVHQSAKSSVLEELMQHLGASGLDKIKGMKKITVASDSKEGLSEGMKKAAEMVEEDPEMRDQDDISDVSAPENADSEDMDGEPSMEHLKSKIAELEAKLAAKA